MPTATLWIMTDFGDCGVCQRPNYKCMHCGQIGCDGTGYFYSPDNKPCPNKQFNLSNQCVTCGGTGLMSD